MFQERKNLFLLFSLATLLRVVSSLANHGFARDIGISFHRAKHVLSPSAKLRINSVEGTPSTQRMTQAKVFLSQSGKTVYLILVQ
jgi:hypothetical protein